MEHATARPRIDPRATPFEQTVAFRRFGGAVDPEPDSPEEVYTKALIEEQGFDGLPHVISREELNRYIAAGEVEVFRGLADARYADAFREGSFFVGRGPSGSGAYTASGRDGLAVARQFASVGDGTILRMVIKSDARIVLLEELESCTFRERERRLIDLREWFAHGGRTRYEALVNAAHAEYDDLGRYAAFAGYDVVSIPDEEWHLIVNRTAVRVQKDNVR